MPIYSCVKISAKSFVNFKMLINTNIYKKKTHIRFTIILLSSSCTTVLTIYKVI